MPERDSETTAPRRTVHVIVRGRVQGVGFRAWTVEWARRAGVDGWVRNRDDGSVEAVVSGEAADVARMLDRIAEGPPASRVTDCAVREHHEVPPKGFSHRDGA